MLAMALAMAVLCALIDTTSDTRSGALVVTLPACVES